MRARNSSPRSWHLMLAVPFLWFAAMAAPAPAQDPAAKSSAPTRARLTVPSAAELPAARGQQLAAPTKSTASLAELRASAHALSARAASEHLDIAALAKSLGAGLEPAFLYVRDQIAFEAYPGVLRGASGALLCRAGNDLDRALLLAALLKEKGIATRFAHGKLAPEAAATLLARVFAPRAQQSPMAAVGTWLGDEFSDQLASRARRDYAAVVAALGAMPEDGGAANGTQELATLLQAHTWLQAKDGDKWVDLDASFADGAIGKSACAASETPESLAPAQFQNVTIRILAETLDQGKLVVAPVLEVNKTAVALADHDVFLVHIAGGGQGAGGLLTAKSATDWTPVLLVDGTMHRGKLIAFEEASGGGGGFGFGGALGGGDESPPTLVAEWLELELAAPGRPSTTTRRALIDRAPAAARSAGAVTKAKLAAFERDARGKITAPHELHNLMFSSGAHDVVQWTKGIEVLLACVEETAPAETEPAQTGQPAKPVTPAKPEAKASFADVAQDLAIANRMWQLLSDGAVVAAINDRADVRCYVDAPRIWVVTYGEQQRDLGFYIRTDIVRQDVCTVANGAAAMPSLRERQLWFGVLEGALEHLLIARRTCQLGEDPAVVASASAQLGAGDLRVLRPADAATIATLVKDPDTAARITSALLAGATLILPKAAFDPSVRNADKAWWQVAKSGNLLAVLGAEFGGASMPIASMDASLAPPAVRSPLGPKIKLPSKYYYKSGSSRGGNEYQTLLTTVREFIKSNTVEFAIGCFVAYAFEVAIYRRK